MTEHLRNFVNGEWRNAGAPESLKVLHVALQSARRPIEFVDFDWGADKFLREGVTLPADAVEMLANEFDAILFGALGDPRVPSNQHAADILLGLRFKLDLFVNARPVELFHDSLTPLRDRKTGDVRFMVFRENTEGLYVGIGGAQDVEGRARADVLPHPPVRDPRVRPRCTGRRVERRQPAEAADRPGARARAPRHRG